MRILLLILACSAALAAAAAEPKSSHSKPSADDELETKYRSVPQTYDSTSTIPSGTSTTGTGPLETKKVNPYQPFGSDQPLYGKQKNGDVN